MLQNKHNLSVNKQNLFRQAVLLNVTAAESEEISFVFLHFISGKMFFHISLVNYLLQPWWQGIAKIFSCCL